MKTILTFILLPILSCGQSLTTKINYEDTFEKDGLLYKKEAKKPLIGIVEVWYSAGKKAREITYVNGRPGGPIISWYENGSKEYEGKYISINLGDKANPLWADYENGPWTYWYKNGQKAKEYTAVGGQLEGLYTSWYENGNKESEGKYVLLNITAPREGQEKGPQTSIEGLWTYWYENGQMQLQGIAINGRPAPINYTSGSNWQNYTLWYKNGKKQKEVNNMIDDAKAAHPFFGSNILTNNSMEVVGNETKWSQNGKKEFERTIKSGKGSESRWYDNGQIASERNFVYGDSYGWSFAAEGPVKEWYQNSQKKSEATYFMGSPEGLQYEWYENGQMKLQKQNGGVHREGLPEVMFDDSGERVGYQETKWFENGKKEFERIINQGKGIEITWHTNGQKASERYFEIEENKTNQINKWQESDTRKQWDENGNEIKN